MELSLNNHKYLWTLRNTFYLWLNNLKWRFRSIFRDKTFKCDFLEPNLSAFKPFYQITADLQCIVDVNDFLYIQISILSTHRFIWELLVEFAFRNLWAVILSFVGLVAVVFVVELVDLLRCSMYHFLALLFSVFLKEQTMPCVFLEIQLPLIIYPLLSFRLVFVS